MPYDTFLRGEDELSRRMRPVYGSAPDPMSTNSGQTGQEDMARRFARRRLLMGLQGGLGAGVEAGGGFFGNLLRGASGSLGGTLQANQMQHEEERQSIRDAAEQRKYEEQRDRLTAMLGISRDTLGVSQGHLKLAQDKELRESQKTDDVEDFGVLPQDALGPESPGQVRAPAGLPRGGFKTYAETLGRGKAESLFPKPVAEEPLVQIEGPGGVPMWVPRSQAVGKSPPRERSIIKGEERKALGFFNRAKDADEAMLPLEEEISGLALPDQFRLRFAPNVAQTPSMQLYRQSQRAFSEARLRRESGAVITQHELDSDSKTYFAQPGDSPELIQRKREARKVVLDNLKFQSGRAYDEYYGEPNSPPGQATPKTGDGTGDPLDGFYK